MDRLKSLAGDIKFGLDIAEPSVLLGAPEGNLRVLILLTLAENLCIVVVVFLLPA